MIKEKIDLEIGTIFNVDGMSYQVVSNEIEPTFDNCKNCALLGKNGCKMPIFECLEIERKDETNIVFKRCLTIDMSNPIVEAIKKIAEHYGREPQHRQLAEECAELAQASLKCIRNNFDEKSLDHLKEEIADVHIMINQCLLLNGINKNEIAVKITEKLNRQIKRIEREKNLERQVQRIKQEKERGE